MLSKISIVLRLLLTLYKYNKTKKIQMTKQPQNNEIKLFPCQQNINNPQRTTIDNKDKTNEIKIAENQLDKSSKQQTHKDKLKRKLTNLQQNIFKKIIAGDIKISQLQKNLEYHHQQPQENKQDHLTLRQKILQLNSQLLDLKNDTNLEKELQKKYHREKRKQAELLVNRLKYQKEEFKKKIKFMEVQHRKKDRAYSQQIVEIMRANTQKKLIKKKQQLAHRVEDILKRKGQRQEEVHNKEHQYWSKINEISPMRSHSVKILPQIQSSRAKKKSVDWLSLHQHHFKYEQKSNKFLLYPKNQDNRQIQKQKTPKKNQKLQSIVNNNQMLIKSLKIIKPQLNQSYKRDSNHLLVNIDNKFKQHGNKYLKEAIKIGKSQLSSPLEQSIDIEQTIELKAKYIPLNKNEKLIQFQEKWENTVNQIKAKKIQRTKGLQLLAIVEKRLDRINPEGIPERLRKKLEIFHEEDNMDETKTVSQR